jgi:general stress protein 26
MPMSERTQCLLKLGQLIANVEIAMLTTVRPDGRLVSRPLRTVDTARPFDGTLWFFVRASSHKADEIGGAPHVNLAYASPTLNTYVSVSGRAKLVENRAKVAELWSAALELYFPRGREDRDLVLLRVDVDGAEFWDGPAGWIGQALDFAGGLVTGDKPLTENRSIDLRPNS